MIYKEFTKIYKFPQLKQGLINKIILIIKDDVT